MLQKVFLSLLPYNQLVPKINAYINAYKYNDAHNF